MTIKKAGIPELYGVTPEVARVLGPVKENLELLLGRRGKKIAVLGPTATLADCINKINELVRLFMNEEV